MEKNMYDMKNLVIVGVIFFVVGFGVSWFIFGRGETPLSVQGNGEEEISEEGGRTSGENNTSETPQSSTPPPAQTSALAGGNAIAADNQASGNKAKVRMVTLKKTGWVVVHEDRDGTPGNILGAQRFTAGAYTTGEVDLLRNMTEGKAYYVMLHDDDGDGKFDHKKDFPLLDSTGVPLTVKFMTETVPVVQ